MNDPAAHLSPRIPDHTLLRRIGKGSYGEVWQARSVMGTYRAAKIVYRSSFESDRPYDREFAGIKKFEPLSRSHEGLVDVLQIGRNDELGFFYYIMELADGQATGQALIAVDQETYCPRTIKSDISARGRLPFDECLQLGLSLVSAVAHLHKNGLIHRDIKPSNIILVNGLPKLADIGLVTDVDATLSFVGTEGFIPPEGPGTIQADIYSLGKVLYEISTGKDRQAFPDPPTHIGAYIDQESFLELNEITLKACANEPRHRYQTAEQMHEDLVHLQSGRSVKRLRKMEHYLALAIRIGTAAAIVALLALGAYFFQTRQTQAVKKLADKNLALANEKQKLANENLALAKQSQERLVRWDLGSGERLLAEGDSLGALLWFAEALKAEAGDSEREFVHRVRIAALMGQVPRLVQRWGPYPTWSLYSGGPESGSGIELSPDRRKVAFTGGPGQLTTRILDISTGRVLATLDHDNMVLNTSFSPDGNRAATAHLEGKVRIWNAETGKLLLPPIAAGFEVDFCQFSPDGREIVAAGGDDVPGCARVFDSATGKAITPMMNSSASVHVARFSPDGRYLVTASGAEGTNQNGGEARVWNAATGQPVTPVLRHPKSVWTAWFSPDGRAIATGCGDNRDGSGGEARVWNARTGEPISPLIKPGSAVFAVRFSPDGTRLLTRGYDSVVKLWNAETGELVTQPQEEYAPKRGVNGIAFNPDGRSFVTVSADSIARVWDASTGKLLLPPIRHPENPLVAEFDLDGRSLVIVTESAIYTWDLARRTELEPTFFGEGMLNHARFSPDGKRLATAAWSLHARVFDSITGEPITRNLDQGRGVIDATFSPDGLRVLACDLGAKAQVWNTATGMPLGQPLMHSNLVQSALFSPDGNRILTASSDGTARVWDAANGKPITPPLVHAKPVIVALFSPDGRKVATASVDHTARVWDAATGQALTPPLPRSYDICFSPDGSRVVTCGDEENTLIWDANTGERLGPGFKHAAKVYRARYSPNGRWIATGCTDQTVHIWDVSNGREICPPMNHGASDFASVAFSANSLLLLTTAEPEGFARLWDIHTGDLVASLSIPLKSQSSAFKAEFSPDGNKIVISGHRTGLQLWDISPDHRPIEEIVKTAQVLSSRQVTPAGALVTVETNAWFGSWEKVGINGPTTNEQMVNWHLRQVESVRDSGESTATTFHSSRIIDLRPMESSDPLRRTGHAWRAWRNLGRVRMRHFQFAVASADFENAIQAGSWESSVWATSAFAHLGVGNLASFRKVCQQLILKDGGVEKLRVGWLAPFLEEMVPSGTVDLEALLRKVDKSDNRDGGGSDGPWIFNFGREQYRVGNYDKALEALNSGLARISETDPFIVYPFLAMTHYRLGHEEEAKEWLRKAEVALDEAMANRESELALRQPGALVAGVYVCHEAENLILGREYALPTPQELLITWQRLSAKLPREYQSLSADSLELHRREAEAAEKATNWFAATFHLEPLLETESIDPTIRRRLENARAELSKVPPVRLDTVFDEAMPALEFSKRDAAAKVNQIDLTRFYNATLTNNGKLHISGRNNLASLPIGLQTFAGTEFDVRGVVHLYHQSSARKSPKQVNGIPIALRCKRIHFLHAATEQEDDNQPGFVADDTLVGKFIFHFADGQKREMPICKGLDVRDWWKFAGEAYESKRSVVAWRGTNEMSAAKGQSTRLFKSTWENPHPSVEVESIDYLATVPESGPFLIAITAE